MSEPYSFKTEFSFEIFATDDLEKDLSISVASLDNLKPLIPKGIDLDRNIDLVVLFLFAAIYHNSLHRIFSKKNSTPKRGGAELL